MWVPCKKHIWLVTSSTRVRCHNCGVLARRSKEHGGEHKIFHCPICGGPTSREERGKGAKCAICLLK